MSVERVVDWQRGAHDGVASRVCQTLAACFGIVGQSTAESAQGRRAHVRRGGVQLAKAGSKLEWRGRGGRWRWRWERRRWRRARRCTIGRMGSYVWHRQRLHRRLLAQAEVVGAKRQLDVDAAVGRDKSAKLLGNRRLHARCPCSGHEECEIELCHLMATVDPKVDGVWLICVDCQVVKRAVDWQSGVDWNDEVKVGRWRRRDCRRWSWRRGRRTCARNKRVCVCVCGRT